MFCCLYPRDVFFLERFFHAVHGHHHLLLLLKAKGFPSNVERLNLVVTMYFLISFLHFPATFRDAFSCLFNWSMDCKASKNVFSTC